MRRVLLSLVLVAVVLAWEDPFTYQESQTKIDNEQLVVFVESISEDTRLSHMKFVSLLSGVTLLREWQIGNFSGYAVRHPADFNLGAIIARAEVKYTEPNQRFFISKKWTVHSANEACLTQQDTPSWGLTRTQERLRDLNGLYHHDDNSGAGVVAYIIDTGIYVEHPKFQGRAIWGTDTADKPPVYEDNNGHGTHVAGTVISDTYGLARAGTAVAVKVLGSDGSGSNDGVIAGINWAVKDHQKRGTGRSVANMSLGGGLSQALNSAVAAAVKAGMVFVVAAGNDGRGIIPSPDACKHSPASEPLAVTVGAIDSTDYRADYSNYGTCVKIWAPGSAITSLWKEEAGEKDPINTISGTSMASPHVAGVAVKLWSLNPTATGAEITALLYNTTTNGILHGVKEKKSPDKLVFQSCSA